MKKVIILLLIFMPLCMAAQNWTPDELLIIDRIKTGYSSWQDAINNKDLSIWLKATNPTDDWQGWWSQDGGLWNLDDTKRNFELLTKDIKKYYWINVKPVSIKVYDNVAFIWFYATWATENLKGDTNTNEEKRFQAFRKIDGKWRMSADMIVRRPTEL